MKYVSEYRDPAVVQSLVKEIHAVSRKDIALMEVCGGHTMALHKYGIPSLLPPNIRLLSGPGCPVCVTSRGYIDHSIALTKVPGMIVTTYGDLIRVPGSDSTLDKEKASGADVRIVYSTLEALKIARENPGRHVVFLGIGFETTAPGSAAAVQLAHKEGIMNFYLLSAHKIMPPAMEALITEGIKINGYICPGHVSTITGSGIYNFIAEKYGLGCVVSGFEPTDLLQSVLMLVKQIEQGSPCVEIQYSRVVKPEGNLKAQELLKEVFMLADDWWRGFGVIPQSGMQLNPAFAGHDAITFEVELAPPREEKGCICGDVLKGLKSPDECKLFAKACTPENPVGACMVSNEGSCAAVYKYGREKV
jgi:hydrogenase expression/formation protein HypD